MASQTFNFIVTGGAQNTRLQGKRLEELAVSEWPGLTQAVVKKAFHTPPNPSSHIPRAVMESRCCQQRLNFFLNEVQKRNVLMVTPVGRLRPDSHHHEPQVPHSHGGGG